MELFDICDEQGNPTGDIVERSEAHAKGICHRTAHIWIAKQENGRYKVLLQKRAMNKDSFPGRYDTSSAGHIQAGDEPLESALRELGEELGIKAEASDLDFAGTFRIQYEKEFHGKMFRDNEVAFVFVYQKPVDIADLTIQKEELDGVSWFDLEETYEACEAIDTDDAALLCDDQKFCVPIGGLETVGKYLNEIIR